MYLFYPMYVKISGKHISRYPDIWRGNKYLDIRIHSDIRNYSRYPVFDYITDAYLRGVGDIQISGYPDTPRCTLRRLPPSPIVTSNPLPITSLPSPIPTVPPPNNLPTTHSLSSPLFIIFDTSGYPGISGYPHYPLTE